MQNLLFDDVLLSLCRLTDPAGKNTKENLGIQLLLEKLEPSKTKVRLRQAVERALKKTEFARRWRDKRIAHNDFDQITNPARRLPLATENRVTNAIIAIHHVLRWITARHSDSDMFLNEMGDGDVLEVMGVLADGLKFSDARMAKISANQYSEDLVRNYGWMGEFYRNEKV